MLHKYKRIAMKNRIYYFEKGLKINILFLAKETKLHKDITYKKQIVKYIKIYCGNRMPEKKINIFDIGVPIGQYVFTRKLYAKPEKFFKFKY